MDFINLCKICNHERIDGCPILNGGRRKFEKSCKYKIRYKTKENALNHLKNFKRKNHSGKRKKKFISPNFTPYQCQFCKGYHLGHRHYD